MAGGVRLHSLSGRQMWLVTYKCHVGGIQNIDFFLRARQSPQVQGQIAARGNHSGHPMVYYFATAV